MSITTVRNLKKYREQKVISQDRFSNLVDVTYNTSTKLESGVAKNPRVENLRFVAKALGVSVDDL